MTPSPQHRMDVNMGLADSNYMEIGGTPNDSDSIYKDTIFENTDFATEFKVKNQLVLFDSFVKKRKRQGVVVTNSTLIVNG